MSQAAPILPLSEAAIGKRFRLVKINGGHRLTRRLLRGVVVARGGNRVALGEGVAQKLLGEALG